MTTLLSGVATDDYERELKMLERLREDTKELQQQSRDTHNGDSLNFHKERLKLSEQAQFRRQVAALLNSIDTSWIDSKVLSLLNEVRPQLRSNKDIKYIAELLTALRRLHE